MDDRTMEATEAMEAVLEMIEDGEEVAITKNGKIVAHVVPEPTFERQQAKAAAEEIRRLRVGVSLGLEPGETIKDLAHEGHKY